MLVFMFWDVVYVQRYMYFLGAKQSLPSSSRKKSHPRWKDNIKHAKNVHYEPALAKENRSQTPRASTSVESHSTSRVNTRKDHTTLAFLLVFLSLESMLCCIVLSINYFPAFPAKADQAIMMKVESEIEYLGRFRAIPNILVFTHYVNLLELKRDDNATRMRFNLSQEAEEELWVLKSNIQNTIALHPNAEVRFLTDADCEDSIRNALGPDTILIDYFRAEKRGMYKSDMCRGAALWETGGLYFDVDLGVKMPMWRVLGAYTKFATVKVHEDSKQRPGFFQAFIGASPRHPILKRYLELFVEYYAGKLPLETKLLEEERQMLGVRILYKAYAAVLYDQKRSGSNGTFASVGAIELWQETLYTPQKLPTVPSPYWGTEVSCKYVVVANEGWPSVVPFYSRVVGSRLCPAEHPVE